jgi:phage shock protein A
VKHNGEIVTGLIAALSVFVSMWLVMAPVSAAHMKDYVEVAVEQRLENIELALRDLQRDMVEVKEGLAGVQAVLKE